MKSRQLTNKKIIDTLTKKSFIEILPLCPECVLDVIDLVLEVFASAHFDIFQVEDNTYCLRISV